MKHVQVYRVIAKTFYLHYRVCISITKNTFMKSLQSTRPIFIVVLFSFLVISCNKDPIIIENGTIKCFGSEIGTEFYVDELETTVTVTDREMLESRILNTDDFGTVCTSNITNMSVLFGSSEFNHPIGDWDVSNVTDMSGMFRESTFNSPIGNWDVSNVTNMSNMFFSSTFNIPIGDWDVSNVTNMSGMFRESTFNSPIVNWDVSSVTNTSEMFLRSNFNQDISNWCVENINNEPGGFSTDSPLKEENKPVWGTCPSN